MRAAVVLVLAFVACTGRGAQTGPEPVDDRFARAEGEWQGMLPDREDVWPCTPDGGCGKARACIDGKCLPCLQDAECGGGERCVLEHCVRAELVACTRRRDCGTGEAMCLLSGYSSLDLRGNAEMRAYCLAPGDRIGPTEEERLAESDRLAAEAVPVAPTGPTASERLLEQLRERARRRDEATPEAPPAP